MTNTLEEQERHAYIAGDTDKAQLLARLADAEERADAAEAKVIDLEETLRHARRCAGDRR